MEVDQAKAEQFAGTVIGMVNGAAVVALMSVGQRTGLFETMASLPPATSAEIAAKGGLNERYVREWLGTMVTGGVVNYDPATKKYDLPPEHAASLTNAAGPGNLAAMAQFLPLMVQNEDDLVECFRKGGGVPYSKFPKFQALMAENSALVFDLALLEATVPLVPGFKQKLEQGIDVADVGCGQGHAINLLAQAFPNSRFTGFDFSAEGIAAGQAEAAAMGNKNATFVEQDAATLDRPNAFDVMLVFDAVHDQAKPAAMLANIFKALRPGGTFLCVDIAASSNLEENMEHPAAPMLYWISTSHCMTVSLALDGEGLGAVWGEQKAHEMFKDAGFVDIETKRIEGDAFNNYYVCQKPA